MVLEQNNLEQKTKELDELIDLAEKVSSKIKSLRDNQLRISFLLLIALFTSILIGACVYYIILYRDLDLPMFNNVHINSSTILYFFPFVLSALYYFVSYRNMYRKSYKEIEQETIILNKLHNMITTHKRAFDAELGVVSNAIFEMRLSRIEFNFDSKSKITLFNALEKLILSK